MRSLFTPAVLPLFLAVIAFVPAGVAGAQEGAWARLSPFTEVEVIGDAADVVYQGRRYELVSVEGVPTAKVLAFCRETEPERWEERFATDLVEMMAGMDVKIERTVRLVLRDKATGEVTTAERAPMSFENREATRLALKDLPWRRVTNAQKREALDAFQAALEQRWAYLGPSRFDHRPMIAAARERLDRGMPVGELVLAMQRVIGRGIDGHASIRDWERFTPPGYLPFLVDSAGDRFVAFRPGRDDFLSEGHPYVETIDGRPIADWVGAAAAYVPDGSPQYVRQHGLRMLRSVQFLRNELGLPQKPMAEILLTSPDGNDRRTVRVEVVNEMPVYGAWPRDDHRPDLPAGVAYLRVTDMVDDPAARTLVTTALSVARQKAIKGLVMDVRDNGGGGRDVLRHLAAAVMRPGDPPRIINAAAYRLYPGHGGRMASRYLYPADWKGWSPAERAAVAEFAKHFKPEWPPPRDAYSGWHYMVLSPGGQGDVPPFGKPVVILMNAKCFSATDLFLAGMKGLPGVTLVGTASGGGSANADTVTLGAEPLRARLGTMVSFQADGRMFDTHGVEPDVRVDPMPEFFIGGADAQLQAAARLILGVKE